MAKSEIVQNRKQTPAAVAAAFHKAAELQMRKAMLVVEGNAKRLAPFRTGTLRRSITSLVVAGDNGSVTGTVGTNIFYGEYLEKGTGLYGPRHRLIVPIHARALAWPRGGYASTRGGNGRMTQGSAGPGRTLAGRRRKGAAGGAAATSFAMSVRGIQPRRFFEEATSTSQTQVMAELEQIATVAQELLRTA